MRRRAKPGGWHSCLGDIKTRLGQNPEMPDDPHLNWGGRCLVDQGVRGVTLLEMLVALIVLGLLASLAVPAYQDAVRKARRSEARVAIMAVMQQQERHYSRYGVYQPFSADQPQGFKWFSGESAAASAYELSAASCVDTSHHSCIQVSAQPGTSRVGVAFADTQCGSLMLASNGRKTASGESSTCWQ